jgi:hypothetical protein
MGRFMEKAMRAGNFLTCAIYLLAIAMLLCGCQEAQRGEALSAAGMNYFAASEPAARSEIKAPPGPIESNFRQAYKEQGSPRIMVMVSRPAPVGLPVEAIATITRQLDVRGDMTITPADCDLLEDAIVRELSAAGQVTVKNAAAARGVMTPEQLASAQRGDADAAAFLARECQADILFRVNAATNSSTMLSFTASAAGTADGKYFGEMTGGLDLPLTRAGIEATGKFVAQRMMEKMTRRLAGTDVINVRVYKSRVPADLLLVQKFVQRIPGVTQMRTEAKSRGDYDAIVVIFNGPREAFANKVMFNAKKSRGLQASYKVGDVHLEVEGTLELQVQVNELNPATGKREERMVAITPE